MINKITSNTNFHQPNTMLIFLLFLSIHISKKYRYKQLQGYMNILPWIILNASLVSKKEPGDHTISAHNWPTKNHISLLMVIAPTEFSQELTHWAIPADIHGPYSPQLLQLIDRHHQTIAHTWPLHTTKTQF